MNEIIPEEKCDFRPKRMCHPVRKSRQRSLGSLRDGRRRGRAFLVR